MNHFLFALMFGFVCLASAKAQDTRYVGTWKWHYDSPYEDGEEGPPPRDEFIRIDIEDSIVYVRLKKIGKDGQGRPLQYRTEGEQINVNFDGSIIFNEFICKNDYDKEDRLYYTAWYRYVVKYEGGRLQASVSYRCEGRNSNGVLISDNKNSTKPENRTYYNEKDNW